MTRDIWGYYNLEGRGKTLLDRDQGAAVAKYPTMHKPALT
jgi:hypothetical protein